MAVQFDLGSKHHECIEKTRKLVEEIGKNLPADGNPKEITKKYLAGTLGAMTSESEIYSDYLGMAVSMEELSKYNSLSAYILIEQIVFGEILKAYAGTKASDYLKKGETVSLLCMESGFSGIGSISTKASKVDGGWQLEGSKLVSNEQLYSEKYVVFAKDEEESIRLFLIPEENIKIEKMENALPSANIVFNEIKLSHTLKDEQCIAVINDNFERTLSIARMLIASVSNGIAYNALVKSIEAVKTSKNAQGEAISSSQSAQFTLADMYSELEAARMLTFYAADTIDNGKNAIKIASMAKVKASEAACHLTVEAMHMFGNIGFMASSEFLSLLQRATDSRIKGGTNRLQQTQIYEYMLAKK